MNKKYFLVFIAFLCSFFYGFGQLSIDVLGTTYTIDFDNTLSGVNNSSFSGSGLTPSPSTGQLDSNAWSINGFSDGPSNFGDTNTIGDFARGSSFFNVSTGGLYAFDLGSMNMTLGVQPGGSDFTPGEIVLRIQNNTGGILDELVIDYDIYVRNNEDRANSFNFSHSSDNSSFTSENSLDYVSDELGDAMTSLTSQNITISELNIPNNGFYYLKWEGDDVSGSGSRDEFALDNISVLGSTACSPSQTITDFYPKSGPSGTNVTISGTGLANTSVSFSGANATILSQSATEIIVEVPTGVSSGVITITDAQLCSLETTTDFTILNSRNTGCEGSVTTTDLIISEITDATVGSLTYIELYNGTASGINLSNYTIQVKYNNANNSEQSFSLPSFTLAPTSIYVVEIGTAGYCSITNGAGEAADFDGNIQGINTPKNGSDCISLYTNYTNPSNPGNLIDIWGFCNDKNWRENNNVAIGNKGFDFRRLSNASSLPNSPPEFKLEDWEIIDWIDSPTCSEDDYSDIDSFSTGVPPTVASGPTINYSCNTASISVTGTEGYNSGGDTKELAYQWYYSAPGDLGWTEIPDNAIYDNPTTATLDILDTSSLESYQFYCQVREDDQTCFQASNAMKVTTPSTKWTNSGWSASAPTTNTVAIIDYPYNTASNGSIEACSLIVNAGATLIVSNSTYANVVNNVSNYGTIDIHTQGSFVQSGDGVQAGTFTNSGAGTANVRKTTALFNSTISEINYTYWSSPVNDPNNSGFGEDISTVFPTPVGNRKYYFRAQDYIDSFKEDSNDNDNTTSGQDDIDDNGNDWRDASGVMEIGRGYAITTSGLPPMPGNFTDNSTVFSGALNTGNITVTLYKNNNEISDNNWNFIGNPYPSAISVDDFFSANIADVPLTPPVNGETLGAIFLWSQSLGPNAGNNGNENINFAQSDYAIINRMAQTSGTSTIMPTRFIPSGQGFFVAFTENLTMAVNSITSSDIIFTNSMRRTLNNTQFFGPNGDSQNTRNSDSNSSTNNNILWINLTSDNGVFSQAAIGYTSNATDDDDGWGYDTPRNLSTGTYASLHSVIESSDRDFAIQGKSIESLTLNEIIQLGFDTTINEPTLYKFSLAQFEGSFLNENNIYIKDNLTNITHNLKESDYSFTSEVGEFNERFEIVFTQESLNIGEETADKNALQIIELQNGDVLFKLSSQFKMQSIEIMDVLGRTLYKLNAQGNSQTFTLSNLNQATYLAKVKLTNGRVITKKALKRK